MSHVTYKWVMSHICTYTHVISRTLVTHKNVTRKSTSNNANSEWVMSPHLHESCHDSCRCVDMTPSMLAVFEVYTYVSKLWHDSCRWGDMTHSLLASQMGDICVYMSVMSRMYMSVICTECTEVRHTYVQKCVLYRSVFCREVCSVQKWDIRIYRSVFCTEVCSVQKWDIRMYRSVTSCM